VAGPAYLDWQVTCLFYAALHYVDAYLIATTPGGVRPQGHADRGRQAATVLPAQMLDYRELRDRSEDARYELRQVAQAEVEALRTGQFARIRTQVRGALGLPP
jgi:hypothetical protein